jgi:hypothetical protein
MPILSLHRTLSKVQPAHQASEADPEQHAGSDEFQDIADVQRRYKRTQITQEQHRSQQHQH